MPPSPSFFSKNVCFTRKILILNTHYINTYNQKIYDNDIRNLNLSKIKCSCGSTSHFHRHTSYHRFLIINNIKTKLEITRIKCEYCGCTQALLRSIIISYHIISNPDIIRIIESFRDVTNSFTHISKITGYSRELIKSFISCYLKYHQEQLNVI